MWLLCWTSQTWSGPAAAEWAFLPWATVPPLPPHQQQQPAWGSGLWGTEADKPLEGLGALRGLVPSPGFLPPVCRWGVPGAAHGAPGGLLRAPAQLLPDPGQL